MSGAHPEAEAVSSGRILKMEAAGMNGGESSANSDAVAANNNNEEEEEGGAQVSSALLPANGTAHAQVSIWDLIQWWARKLVLNGKSVNCHDKSAIRKFAKGKSRFLNNFFILYKFELEHYTVYAIFVRKKEYICGLAEVLSPEITKRLSPQIANPQSDTFADPQD
jgi:hypothetical protein